MHLFNNKGGGIKTPPEPRSFSYHHEVELAVGAAHGFKFKRDATELRPRLAGHGGGESDGRGKRTDDCKEKEEKDMRTPVSGKLDELT